MSIGQLDHDVAARVPIERVRETCERFGVSRLWLHGPILERVPGPEEEIEFLVEFLNNDSGPYGNKLDRVENDLSGAMHRGVTVSSKRGLEDSANPFERDRILREAKVIYDSAS